ncbi:MAG: hypothetical protein AB7V16_09570 [Vulcanibacillus sp.]
MFIFEVIKLINLFIIAYFVGTIYKDNLPIDNHLSDWTMKLMINDKAMIISYLCLVIILILSKNIIVKMILTYRKKGFRYKYKKLQLILVFVLLSNLLFYLIIEYKYYLVLPFLTVIFIEYVLRMKNF